jgi:foldase protein PrsA
MRKSVLLIPVAVAVAVLVAGCGGGSSASKLSSGDVAVVGDRHITQASLDEILTRAKKSYQRQGQKFPAQGTASYQTIRDQAVSLLVQQTEFEEKAASMGVSVTNAEVNKRLAFLKKQYYGGSQKKYLADIKTQGYTDAQVREEVIKPQLISEKVQKEILKDVKVSDADVQKYYTSHLSSYTQPPTRTVRYILVGKSKATAQSVYKQLKNGTAKTWCTLAKKYAKDASGRTAARRRSRRVRR